MTKTKKTTFDFGSGPVPAHRHINRNANGETTLGGWVANSAYVAPTVYVGENAIVYDNAEIYDNARISGYARIYGNAFIYDNAEIYGYAKIYGDANICGNARIHGNAVVSKQSDYIYGYVLGYSYTAWLDKQKNQWFHIGCKSLEVKKLTTKQMKELVIQNIIDKKLHKQYNNAFVLLINFIKNCLK